MRADTTATRADETQQYKYCYEEDEASQAGTYGIVCMMLYVATFVSLLSGANECCNIVFCKKFGSKTFNSGTWLLCAWLTFIFGIIMLYYATMHDLNTKCPIESDDDTLTIVENGFFAAGTVLCLMGVVFAAYYYLSSMHLAAVKGEYGLLSVKRRNIQGTVERKPVKVDSKAGGLETEMVSVELRE